MELKCFTARETFCDHARSICYTKMHCCAAAEQVPQAQAVGEVIQVNELAEQAATSDNLSTASECRVPPLTSDGNKLMTGSQTADTSALVRFLKMFLFSVTCLFQCFDTSGCVTGREKPLPVVCNGSFLEEEIRIGSHGKHR